MSAIIAGFLYRTEPFKGRGSSGAVLGRVAYGWVLGLPACDAAYPEAITSAKKRIPGIYRV